MAEPYYGRRSPVPPIHWFLPRWLNFITHDGFLSWLWPTGTVMLRIMKDRESNKWRAGDYGVKLRFSGKNQVQSGCIFAAYMLIASHAGRQWDHGKIAYHQCFTKLSSACTLCKFCSSAQLQPYICKLIGFSHAPNALTIQFSKHILNTTKIQILGVCAKP